MSFLEGLSDKAKEATEAAVRAKDEAHEAAMKKIHEAHDAALAAKDAAAAKAIAAKEAAHEAALKKHQEAVAKAEAAHKAALEAQEAAVKKAIEAQEAAQKKAMEAKEAMAEKAAEAQAAAEAKAGELKSELDQKTSELQNAAAKFKEEKLSILNEFELEMKKKIAGAVASRINALFNYAMDTLRVFLTEKLTEDEYMPGVVKSMIEILIDALWPDVKANTKEAILSVATDPPPIDHGKEPCCCRYNPVTIIRYTLYPYDRNIWRLIRDPLWWLLFLISIIPRYAISQIYYILLFLFIDKNDQYQMLSYIAEFKGIQFLSLGVASCMVGALQYYLCTAKTPNDCHSTGPNEQIFTLGFFVAQVIVTWMAFMLSFGAKKKGGSISHMDQGSKQAVQGQLKAGKEGHDNINAVIMGSATEEASYEEDEELERVCKHRFAALLIYDFIIFLICVALTLWVAFGFELDEDARVTRNDGSYSGRNWKFTHSLYWIKTFYGLMAFPFVLLRLPVVQTLFAHAKPTAYNWWGNTVPYLGKEEKEVPWRDPEPEEQPMQENEPANAA